jgi:hypothetical protein
MIHLYPSLPLPLLLHILPACQVASHEEAEEPDAEVRE